MVSVRFIKCERDPVHSYNYIITAEVTSWWFLKRTAQFVGGGACWSELPNMNYNTGISLILARFQQMFERGILKNEDTSRIC